MSNHGLFLKNKLLGPREREHRHLLRGQDLGVVKGQQYYSLYVSYFSVKASK